MSDKVLNELFEWIRGNLPFFYATALSLWGGFVQYADRVRLGEPWSWRTMFLDLVICSFSGLIAFFICQSLDVIGWKAAIVIAISAHEGPRTIESFVTLRDKILGVGK